MADSLHKRSNIESTLFMMKRNSGDSFRSKTDVCYGQRDSP
jgi:hypothetical protein